MKSIVIVGIFQEIIELAEDCGWAIHGTIDSKFESRETTYPIIATDATIKDIVDSLPTKFLIITPDYPWTRSQLLDKYRALGFSFPTLVSPAAKVSRTALVQEGTVVQWGCNISAESRIGRFVKLNTNATVMHDARIGDFTTIAPNATILGRVKIGSHCYIGANATILPNIEIGDNVTVGAGAVVTKDIASNLTVAGVPARVHGSNVKST